MRATWSANNAGTVTGLIAHCSSRARLPMESRRACSVGSSTSIDDSLLSTSAVIAVSTSSKRPSSRSMLAGSKTSVRNSTVPPIPAGSPLRVRCSAREKLRSMRAVWVSASIGVTSKSPSASPGPDEPLSCPGTFCQPSATWINGWCVNDRVGLSRSTSTSKGTSWFS
ncbi:Uncharacterised protein [Mycobacteroides abscessus subsp. abscessus]|nr:Uncharacterised protein [Mycobacteroides abscessus subsp. abscessus]